MSTLNDLLLTDEKRPVVVQDCVQVIKDEVASKRGVSGLAIKGAFKALGAIRPTMVRDSVDGLLNDFVDRLQGFYTRYTDAGKPGGIETYLTRNAGEVAEALLGITDDRARTSSNGTVKKLYGKLRPQGKKQVEAAMPRIGRMLAKHGL